MEQIKDKPVKFLETLFWLLSILILLEAFAVLYDSAYFIFPLMLLNFIVGFVLVVGLIITKIFR
jgi:membrane protein YdbS with pleckstrin-like domain